MEIAVLILLLGIPFWILCGIGAGIIAANRGARGAEGCIWFILGIFFGPFGLIFAFAANTGRRCPFCRKHIDPQAVKCPYCQSLLPEAKPAQENSN